MPDKGLKTKAQILQAAKALFIQKGYAAVSMSDLCLATGLSRGGLYRHFASVDQAFAALLTSDKDNWQQELDKAMAMGVSARQMLDYCFQQFRLDISQNAGRLSLATYEYERSGQARHDFLQRRYESAVAMMEALIRYGQARGEFCEGEPHTKAEHLVIFLEGLKIASTAIAFSQEQLSRQLDHQRNDLIAKDGKLA